MVTFRSLHPRYSYMLVDDNGLIVEAAEKRPISRHATAGFYWYRRGADFVQSAQDMIRKDAHVDEKRLKHVEAIVNVVLPVFAIVLVGFACGQLAGATCFC